MEKRSLRGLAILALLTLYQVAQTCVEIYLVTLALMQVCSIAVIIR